MIIRELRRYGAGSEPIPDAFAREFRRAFHAATRIPPYYRTPRLDLLEEIPVLKPEIKKIDGKILTWPLYVETKVGVQCPIDFDDNVVAAVPSS
jgi:hypothetical protein